MLTINGTTDTLRIYSHLDASDAYRVEEIRFADGTMWTPTTIPMLISGSSASDVINGTAGPDVIESGAGSDVISGGTGNDTYRYYRGDGADYIFDFDATAGNLDKILFAADILPSQVQASRSGSDLRLTLTATDSVAVNNYFQNDGVTPYSVEQIKFMADGTMLNGSMLGMDGMEVPIANGKIEGSNLSYTLSLDFGGMPFELSYKGVLAGDQIALTGEAGGMPFEFVVKRDKTQ